MQPNILRSYKLLVLGLGVLVIATAGCATKKYVQNSVQEGVQPLQVGLKNEDQKTAQNAQQIRDVDRRAESGIADAQNAASQANQAATTADQHAQAAHQVAEQGLTAANTAQDMVNNIDNYQASQHTTVLFRLDQSVLTTSDKQNLDQLIQQVKGLKHYAIQVQGYTDTTGPKQLNLRLSEQRAQAVVRYLTLNGEIPLVKIYSLGYGEATPAQSNRTRKGRQQNRRVDVTVMVPQMPGQPTSQSAQAEPSPGAVTQ